MMNLDEEVESLKRCITKIQKIYRRDASPKSSSDKLNEKELDSILDDLQTNVMSMHEHYQSVIDTLRKSLSDQRIKNEQKNLEWSTRYDKVQNRWDTVMKQMKELQYEKEQLRQERDLLLCESKKSYQKRALLRGEPTDIEKEAVSEFFGQAIQEMLIGIKEALNAERASVFIYNQPSEEMVSMALEPEIIDGKQIRVPCDRGIVGDVFTKGKAVNILNAYKDNRFYKNVDKETGFTTKVVLAYPLVSSEGTSIGCVQLINKKSGGVFTVEDEIRMSQFVYLMSRVFDCAKQFYDVLGFEVGRGGGICATKDSAASSLINVERIGEKDKRTEDIGILQKHGGVIPKYIEDFIHNLHKSWRIAVDDSGRFQNKIDALKHTNVALENEISELKKSMDSQKLLVRSLNETIMAISRESVMKHAVSFAQGGDFLDSQNRLKMINRQLKDHEGSPHRKHVTLPLINQSRNTYSEPYHENRRMSVKMNHSKKGNSPVIDHSQPQFYQEVFENCPVSILLLTPNFQICACNKSFCRILNYRPHDLIGMLLQTILHKVDVDMLPRLLQFSSVEKVAFKKKTRNYMTGNGKQNVIVKLDLQISTFGNENVHFKLTKPNRTIRGPIYAISFMKSSS